MNVKIVVQYDGTRYSGWQAQNHTPDTIQGKIEDVLTKFYNQKVEITGSGRTDAGVHALGQVANFHVPNHFSPEQIQEELNRYLPKDIAVVSCCEVEERFHSRLSATGKTYMYRIHTGRVSNVFERKFYYDYEPALDLSKMQKAASALVGTHDFKSFCGNKHMKKSTVRTITNIRFEQTEDELIIYYTGNGFLMNMVRILTGTLIEVGDGRRNPVSMESVLGALNRDAAGYTAPPQGLYLKEVYY